MIVASRVGGIQPVRAQGTRAHHDAVPLHRAAPPQPCEHKRAVAAAGVLQMVQLAGLVCLRQILHHKEREEE